MKTLLLLISIALSLNSHGQTTVIPDVIFEQMLISFGYDDLIDGEVLTSNIIGVTTLDVSGAPIADLTGIEDFGSLISLKCSSNQFTSLDLTQNTALTYLDCSLGSLEALDISQNSVLITLHCYSNQLTSLDISQNTILSELICYNNQLTSIDLIQNTNLTQLVCYTNQLTILDLSQNTALTDLRCNSNQLSCLSVKNGNNFNHGYFDASSNTNLTCVEVDDVTYSSSNWNNIDPQTSFSTACSNPCAVGLEELSNTPKQLVKITDLIGRETTFKPNTPLIYIYSDGTTEKVFKLD